MMEIASKITPIKKDIENNHPIHRVYFFKYRTIINAIKVPNNADKTTNGKNISKSKG